MVDVPSGEGMGLALSGGGYRAMLFHLGTLRRLNDAGWLPRLRRITSVSGGSFVSAKLALAWPDLDFDESGVARRFAELVEDPVFALAGRTIDVPAVLTGLWPGRISRRAQASLDKHLFHGATVRDLPDPAGGAPEFFVLATDLTTGTMCPFSRAKVGGYRGPSTTRTDSIPLARAVAASSAFPPVLSPCVVDLPSGAKLHLTDGGVYDNLGVEPLKTCATVLVSDGGGTFSEPTKPRTGFFLGTVRVLGVIDVQVRRLRRRELISRFKRGRKTGAFWAINTDPAKFKVINPALPCPSAQTDALAHTRTRLAKLDVTTRHRIANWGYAATEHSLRSNGLPEIGQATGFPFPGGVGEPWPSSGRSRRR